MRRPWKPLGLGLSAGLTALAVLSGCASSPSAATATPQAGSSGGVAGTPGPSGPVAASAGGSANPTGLPSPGAQPSTAIPKAGGPATLTSEGAGPYMLNTAQATLASQGLLSQVKTTAGCPGWATAKGTGVFSALDLVFYNGKLDWIDVSVVGMPTPAGAHVGMPMAQVKALYPGGVMISDGGTGKALAVRNTASSHELFFRFGASGAVAIMEAGPIETLEFRFTNGEGC